MVVASRFPLATEPHLQSEERGTVDNPSHLLSRRRLAIPPTEDRSLSSSQRCRSFAPPFEPRWDPSPPPAFASSRRTRPAATDLLQLLHRAITTADRRRRRREGLVTLVTAFRVLVRPSMIRRQALRHH
ncbi:hypothetical protein JX265_003839 [Neoarthrinium moseri]|uniref:Uncharacterized protein n=1 Tax=Neoarthrinium moseri TaxID=1658444 RepID=A0A9P9WR87_9PEZI|nr:hypothetical protein JX265_003839 [Neoarthrinium moseri]